MKTQTIKPDTESKLIIELHRNYSDTEYIVRQNAALTLVIIAKDKIDENQTIHVRLPEPGARAFVLGLIQGTDKELFTLHTLQHHEAPDTASNLLVKCVLSDASRFTYDGAIRVEKKAQKTDAYQRNENLLLTSSAFAQSKPSLEILANDVRCTHGATIGSLSDDHLWYLANRGIGGDTARQLLVRGFFEDAISKISDTIIQKKVREKLWQA